MSKKNEIEIVCPHCEEKQNVIVWSSLNITLDPEARKRLLKDL
jgi:RNA polymerase subunit RPABC4/transcription elongation factor Spt4